MKIWKSAFPLRVSIIWGISTSYFFLAFSNLKCVFMCYMYYVCIIFIHINTYFGIYILIKLCLWDFFSLIARTWNILWVPNIPNDFWDPQNRSHTKSPHSTHRFTSYYSCHIYPLLIQLPRLFILLFHKYFWALAYSRYLSRLKSPL